MASSPWPKVRLGVLSILLVSVGVVTGAVTPASAAPTVTDLGTLGGTNSYATGVDGDTVVGSSSTTGGATHAFAYDLGTGGPLTDLGTLGGTYSSARGVDGDTVVGESRTAGGATHAFAYDLGTGTMTDLGTLGGNHSSAWGVSGDTVVGSSATTGNAASHAFAYDLGTGTWTDLGTLGGASSVARGVSGDTVVGDSSTTGDTGYHAFAYDLGTGTMTGLGTPDGDLDTHTFAFGVSGDTVVGRSQGGIGERAIAYDLGTSAWTVLDTLGGTTRNLARGVSGDTVVGSSSLGDTGDTGDHAFAYDLGTGTMTDLGTLGGTISGASAVSGDSVVGSSDITGDAASHATVWSLGETDNTAPTLTLPADITVFTIDPAGDTVEYTATADDDVDGPVIPDCAPASGSLFGPGDTTVNCSATDTAGNEATGSFTVTVNSASQAIADLGTLVQDTTDGETSTSLLSLLNGATKSLAKGKTVGAVNKLNVFIKQVNAQTGKKISTTDAAPLVAAATEAITGIQSSP